MIYSHLLEHDKKLENWMKDLHKNKDKQKLVVLSLMPYSHSVLKNSDFQKYLKDFNLNDLSVSGIYHRRQHVLAKLDILNEAIEYAQSRVIKSSHPFIQDLRDAWNTNSKLREKVNEFKQTLEKALKHYNKQTVLLQLMKAKKRINRENFGNWKKHGVDIPLEDIEVTRALEDEYYKRGNVEFFKAEKLGEELQKNPLTKWFSPSVEEVKEILRERAKNGLSGSF
ncbi:Uncharacterised protein [uncultured archaeon]|nr:Uncharacterised protein [uncultured archaeon]